MNFWFDIIPLLNFSIMIIATILLTFFYIKSVQPAKLEKIMGEKSYEKCGNYRIIATIFMSVVIVNYVIYFFFPLTFPFPRYLPWNYWISVIIAICFLTPSLWLMLKGVRDAGLETLKPSKDSKLYEGIYSKIRHPQALGEVWIWYVVAFFLHSIFLILYSMLFIPIFYLFCFYEEKDLELRYGNTYIKYKEQTGMFFPKTKK